MVRNEDADAAFLEKADDFLDFQHGDRVHAGKGFVEQDEARSGCQSAGDFHAPPFPPGQGGRIDVADVTDVQLFQQVFQLRLLFCFR